MSIYFTSVEKPIPSQLISLLRGLFLIIPVAICLAFILKINGVWLSYPLTELLVALFAVIIYFKISRYENAVKTGVLSWDDCPEDINIKHS